MNIGRELVDDSSFRLASEIGADVPRGAGIYAIRLRSGTQLPEPFESLLAERSSRLIYIGKATSLKRRMLGNELRGHGHGTFFRSIGAVLDYRPTAGSLTDKANKYNFSFEKRDCGLIVDWINSNLEVSWQTLPLKDVRAAESALIPIYSPLLNLEGNPLASVELKNLRTLCRRIASRPSESR